MALGAILPEFIVVHVGMATRTTFKVKPFIYPEFLSLTNFGFMTFLAFNFIVTAAKRKGGIAMIEFDRRAELREIMAFLAFLR